MRGSSDTSKNAITTKIRNIGTANIIPTALDSCPTALKTPRASAIPPARIKSCIIDMVNGHT
jgi:hypothetical protein